jgi:NAD(P)-dependent dehydrogenase (short-subunit alcohol dehydrogenase family)
MVVGRIDMDLEGTVVLITGAKGGLGTFVTNAFLESGATVVGASRSIADADFSRPGFSAVPAELGSLDAALALASTVVDKHGRIDALVHLVGAFTGGQSVADIDDATFDRMFDLNFRSTFHIVRAVLPQMRRQKGGRVLAIGSRTALEPQPGIGAYTTSKAALVALMRTVAVENSDVNITANIILPGTMDTPANRKAMPSADYSRWVDPRQVAALLVHLASPLATQVTSAVIPVYGGEV